MAYTTIPASSVDADSPVDETLMQLIKSNEDDLDSRAVTNGDSHDHAGGDGAEIITAGIADDAVTDEKLARVHEVQCLSPYTGTTLLDLGIGLASTLSGGTIASGTDTSNNYLLLRADNITTYSYLYDSTSVTESGHEALYKGRIKTDSSISDLRLWVGLTSNNTNMDSDSTPDLHVSAFRYATDDDGTAFWRCVTIAGTGASAEVTTTTQSIAVDTVYDLEIRPTASSHTFYINGTLVATNNSVVPTSTTGLQVYVGAASLSNTGNARGILWNSSRVIKEA